MNAPSMHIGRYVGLAIESERVRADALVMVALRHANEPDIREGARLLAGWCEAHIRALDPAARQYGMWRQAACSSFRRALFHGRRSGGFGALRDLHDLLVLVQHAEICWTVLLQSARELKDHSLEATCRSCAAETARERAWLETNIRHRAAQSVVVGAEPMRELLASIPSRTALTRMRAVIGRPILRTFTPLTIAALAGVLGAAMLQPGKPMRGRLSAATRLLAGASLALPALRLGHRLSGMIPGPG